MIQIKKIAFEMTVLKNEAHNYLVAESIPNFKEAVDWAASNSTNQYLLKVFPRNWYGHLIKEWFPIKNYEDHIQFFYQMINGTVYQLTTID